MNLELIFSSDLCVCIFIKYKLIKTVMSMCICMMKIENKSHAYVYFYITVFSYRVGEITKSIDVVILLKYWYCYA